MRRNILCLIGGFAIAFLVGSFLQPFSGGERAGVAANLGEINGNFAEMKRANGDLHAELAKAQKDIKVLEERLAKLTAELAKIQPAEIRVQEVPAGIDLEGRIGDVFGEKEASGFSMIELGGLIIPFWPGPDIQIIQLRPDTQIVFSDGQKANPSDLKIGQVVSVRASQAGLTLLTDPPKHVREGYVVVIKKAK